MKGFILILNEEESCLSLCDVPRNLVLDLMIRGKKYYLSETSYFFLDSTVTGLGVESELRSRSRPSCSSVFLGAMDLTPFPYSIDEMNLLHI